MINFSKVRYKNFLSTGQQFIEAQDSDVVAE